MTSPFGFKSSVRVSVLFAVLCGFAAGFPSDSTAADSPIPLLGPVGRLEGAVWEADGYGGTPALRFDGRGAAFSISAEQVGMRHMEIAVEFRLKTTALLHQQNIVIGQYAGPRSTESSWVVLLDKAGKPSFALHVPGGSVHTLTADVSLADDKWRLVRASYDQKTMRLEVDGKEVATKQVAARMNYPRQPVRIGGGPIGSETDAGEQGGFRGLIDDVRLYDRPTEAPDEPAAQFDFNEGHGDSVRGLGGTATANYFGNRDFALVKNGRPNFTIVHGKNDAETAGLLRDKLTRLLGAAPPMVEADQVLEPGTWRLADQWMGENLLLMGNIHTNLAILPLYSRLLAGTSARYPGPGRYEIRTLFAPLHRKADVILLGASDASGLDAAQSRFLRLVWLAIQYRDGAMPPFSELGGAAGPDVTSRDPVYGEFGDRVREFFWHGNLTAGRFACDALLSQLESRKHGLWGFDERNHYESARHYCALRQLIAAGALSEEQRIRVDERLLQNALENKDSYQVRAVTADPDEVSRHLDRHLLSSVLGQFVALEYLDNIGHVPTGKQAEVQEKHQRLRGHIDAFIRQGRFRADREGKEGLDCVSALADLYLRAGDERLFQANVFSNMADYYVANVDNLGCQAGQDAYITSMPGQHFSITSGGLGLLAAAYFHQDGQYRWLHENLRRFSLYWGKRFRVEYAPETLSLPSNIPAVHPKRYVGLSLVTIEPWRFEEFEDKAATEAIRPTKTPREKLFSKAVFRDGCRPEDAYLMLQGINPGGADGYQGNALVRFTELGSLLLFQNAERQCSWARSVVSTSRGGHDPQAPACVREASFSSPTVSGISSVLPHDGGVAWRRSLVRRHGGYFVVLDEMTADSDDTYHLTCRWRSFNPGESDGGRTFRALDGMTGAVLQITASEPVAQRVRLEPRDGSTEPTILCQYKTADLKAGGSATFQNLVYTTNDTVGREFDIRRLGPRSVLVSGTCRAFQETAAIGTGSLDPLQNAKGDGGLWYLSNHGLAISATRQFSLPGWFRIEASEGCNVLLFPFSGLGDIVIQNPNTTPVDVTVDFDGDTPVRLDDRSLTEKTRLRLPPGDHSITTLGSSAFFERVDAELKRLWKEAVMPEESSNQPAAYPTANPWREVWRVSDILPPLEKHRTIKATAEPPTTIGDPADWVDRVLYYRNEPSAGWDEGIEGAVILDLHEEVAVDSVRLVGRLDSFDKGDMSFELAMSNDGFAKDVRRQSFPSPPFDTQYAEMVSYMSTYRFPAFVLPVGQRARQLKIVGRWREKKEPVVFYEIEVVTQERQQRAKVSLFAGRFFADERRTLLAAGGNQLMMLSPEGKRLWRRELESPLINVNVADVNSDGKQDVIAFTLAEKMHVYNGDGSPRFVHDVRQGDTSSVSYLRPAFVGAWRPDKNGNLEYYFLPHVRYGRVSPEPELKQSVTPSLGDRGGKYAFTVPDVTGDGREELAVVGRYGMGFGVLDSGSDLAAGKLRYLATRSLTGHSTPNMQLPQYFDGAVVRTTDDESRWLGVVTLNPGGVNYFSAPKFSPVWSRFTHTTNACHCLGDVTGDDVPEVLVGREDGFLIQYALADGELMNKTYCGGEIRAVAAIGDGFVVGTSEGLLLLDNGLRAVGFASGAVQAIRVIESPASEAPLIAVAFDSGAIAGMNLDVKH
ncbi:MAG: LamG domain-containing protein [Planctomycetes bacterium]|nr:LamG domain-containing protein [Planctomycetota bacterium]MBL7037299.1 LamG domain-containing protein [Pirellulaceae bacterium]